MLVVKGSIYRNVTEQEAEKLKQQGYIPVPEKVTEQEAEKPKEQDYAPVPEKESQKRGAKDGGAKS